MNENNTRKLEYAAAIQAHLAEMLTDEECIYYIEDWQEHLTEFFTAAIMAVSSLHGRVTDDSKSFLEFSYLVNRLIVQHIIEQREDETINTNI